MPAPSTLPFRTSLRWKKISPIVRQIFDYALEGRGPVYIHHRLEMDKIPCPTWWNRQRGIRSHFTKWELADPEKGRFLWDDSVIKDMLINPVYMGCMASQKKNYRFKIGTIGEKKPEDWIIVEGTHEAIVTAEEFEIVQQKLKARQRPRDDGNFSLFAGLIKCGECGKALTIRKTNAKQPKDIYACVTYNRYGKHHCTQHRIEYDVLYDMVLSKIQECAAAALADDEEVLDQLSDSFRSDQEGQLQAITRQVAKDTERLALLDRMVVKLYEDMIAGRISEANFNLMMKKAQDKQAELTDRVKHNKELLTDQDRLTRDNQQWLDISGSTPTFRSLTPSPCKNSSGRSLSMRTSTWASIIRPYYYR